MLQVCRSDCAECDSVWLTPPAAALCRSPVPCGHQNSLFEVKYDRDFYELLFTPNYACFIARERSAPHRIVAVSSIRADNDEQSVCSYVIAQLRCQKVAYLLTLGVHDDWRKRGLAKRMLQVRSVAAATNGTTLCSRYERCVCVRVCVMSGHVGVLAVGQVHCFRTALLMHKHGCDPFVQGTPRVCCARPITTTLFCGVLSHHLTHIPCVCCLHCRALASCSSVSCHGITTSTARGTMRATIG